MKSIVLGVFQIPQNSNYCLLMVRTWITCVSTQFANSVNYVWTGTVHDIHQAANCSCIFAIIFGPSRGNLVGVNPTPAGLTQPGRPSRGEPSRANPAEQPFHLTVQSKRTITWAVEVRFEKFNSLTSSSLMWLQFT